MGKQTSSVFSSTHGSQLHRVLSSMTLSSSQHPALQEETLASHSSAPSRSSSPLVHLASPASEPELTPEAGLTAKLQPWRCSRPEPVRSLRLADSRPTTAAWRSLRGSRSCLCTRFGASGGTIQV